MSLLSLRSSFSISSGDFDLVGVKKRTPLDLLRSWTLVKPPMEPELDLRVTGMELEPDKGVWCVRGNCVLVVRSSALGGS